MALNLSYLQEKYHIMRFVLFLFLQFFGILCFSQSKVHLQTFAGLEGGIMLSIPRIEDSGNQLLSKWANNGCLGFVVKQEIYSNLYFSFGANTQKYNVSFRFKDDDATTSFKKINLIRFPLKVAYEIPLKFGVPELQVGLSVGLNYYLNQNPGLSDSKSGFIGSDIKNSYYKLDSKYSDEKFGMQVDGAAYLNILMAKGTVLTIGTAYYYGVKDLLTSSVIYKKAEGFQEISSKINGKADMLSIWIGVHYPISKWWRKRNALDETEQENFFKR